MTRAYTRAPTATASVVGRWIPVAVWSTAILVLSCLPVRGVWPNGFDRVFHAAFYAVLALLVARALAAHGEDPMAVAAGTLVGTLAFGGLMEWIQGFVGRSPDVVDWAADGVGIVAALVLRGTWFHLRERTR